MTKVIENIELLKKLNEWGYLEFYVENYIDPITKEVYSIETINEWCHGITDWFYKTLTLEEAIELLPSVKYDGWFEYSLTITKSEDYYWINYDKFEVGLYETIYEKTLLEAIEKMLEYLLDNELLWKTANQ